MGRSVGVWVVSRVGDLIVFAPSRWCVLEVPSLFANETCRLIRCRDFWKLPEICNRGLISSAE